MVNYFLRGFSLLFKMLFVVFLAKLLTVENVATYGLFNSYLALFVFISGLEFYTYSQRELIDCKNEMVNSIIHSHFRVVLISLCLTCAFIVFVRASILLPSTVFVALLIIIIFELVSQDLGRILIALRRVELSTYLFFIRSGIWPVLSVMLFLHSDDLRHLELVLVLWGGASFLSVLFGFVILIKLQYFKFNVQTLPISWFIAGFKISSFYIVSALLFKLTFSLDRIVINKIGFNNELAVYTLFVGMALSMQSFLAATVYNFALPSLVASFSRFDFKTWIRLSLIFFAKVILMLLGMVFILKFIAPYLLLWIGKREYLDNVLVLNYSLFMSCSFTMATATHMVVYSMRADKFILHSRLIALFVVILAFMLNAELLFFEFVYQQVLVSLSVGFGFLSIVNIFKIFNIFNIFKEARLYEVST